MVDGRLTPGIALRSLAKAGALPADAVMTPRRGLCDWHERGMWLRLALGKATLVDHSSGLNRWLYVSPAGAIGDLREEGGLGAGIRIESDGPLPGSYGSVDELGEFVLRAREFVVDIHDLCWLLWQEHDVHRGELHARLYSALPARLVQALALARQLGDADQEQEIVKVLHSGRRVRHYLKDEDILVVARSWAKEFRRDSGMTVEL